MLINIILSVLVITLITALNTILTKEAIQRELTFSEIIAENQDTRICKVFMILCCIPTFIILYIKSLLPVSTKSCFDEEDDDKLTCQQICEKYSRFYDVSEHYVAYVRNGIVEDVIYESDENFEDTIQNITNLNLKKIRRFSKTLYILPEVLEVIQ